jgi:Leucine-rich repeat (LRR) protein
METQSKYRMKLALKRIADIHDGRLDLSYLGLTELPPLPPTLLVLDCTGNALTELPQLGSEGTSSTLKRLHCTGNALTSLPPLPSTLKYLYCGFNQLTELPQLPSTLVKLYCGNNQLTSLPSLPSTLKELDCGFNMLTKLPSLPLTLDLLDYVKNEFIYPPSEITEHALAIEEYYCLTGHDIDFIRNWINENPLTLIKSTYKV